MNPEKPRRQPGSRKSNGPITVCYQHQILLPHLNLSLSVLTDPNKRAIYDLFGEEGLKTKWDVGLKYKTAEEVCNFLE